MTDQENHEEEPETAAEETISPTEQHGSSVAGAIFNFTNSVIGAGAIGLGGAFALSGGLISIVAILFFGVLTKWSLDLVIRLSLQTEGASSYEDLGEIGFGTFGRIAIMGCKFLYSFGCLVAYIVVIKDNFGSALRALFISPRGLLAASTATKTLEWLESLLKEDIWITWAVSSLIILPLCMLRDMTPLSSLSALSVVAMFTIVFIVVYLYIADPDHEIRHPDSGSFHENWLQVRPGFVECLGTFVFTFVSQHTVHLTFDSLKPHLRTLDNWKRVSTVSIGLAATVSLSVGVVVYMSFWQDTKSDIFQIYPALPAIDLAKLLLCITMILTFPLPFFTCRELLIVLLYTPLQETTPTVNEEFPADIQEPLLEHQEVSGLDENGDDDNDDECINVTDLDAPLACDSRSCGPEMDPELSLETVAADDRGSVVGSLMGDRESVMDLSVLSAHAINLINSCLIPGEQRQLKWPYHLALTGKLWFAVTGLAIASPNLGDVLDVVGCFSGTLIAFIFPACLAFRLQGFSVLAVFIFCVGGIVGTVGTFYSCKQLIKDIVR